ncbi:hypothetical protein LTS18_011211, partial [Coniosporium uncinatum]
WINIVEVDLPQLEDLDLFWMQAGKIHSSGAQPKEEVFATVIQLVPRLLKRILADGIGQGITTIIIGVSRLLPKH